MAEPGDPAPPAAERGRSDVPTPDAASAPAKIEAYRPDIDGLRAVAVISVVLFHVSARLMPGGFVGVDIFFVISGYLISGILYKEHQQGRFSIGEFYGRRIRRLGPALVVVLPSILALGWFVLLAGEYESLGRHTVASAGFVSNLLLYHEVDYFGAAAGEKPLLHLWSLAIEEQFYLFWPLLLWLGWKRMANLTAAIVACIVVSFVACVLTTRATPAAAFYLPHTRYWELLVGALVAYVERRRRLARVATGGATAGPIAPWNEALAWGGTALLAVALVVLDKDVAFPGWWAAVPVAGTAALIAAGPRTWINRVVLGNRPMIYVGGLAYPIYLWHWPLLVFVALIGATHQLQLLAVMATFGLAWLTKVLVEDPIRFGFPSARANRHVTAWALFGALLCVGGLGLLTAAKGGVPSRFPPALQTLASYPDKPPTAPAGTPHCLLGAEETAQAFSPACAGNAGNAGNATPTAPDSLVMVWGDSFGDHLTPGLDQLRAERGFALARYTASACPPVPDVMFADRRNCRGINAFVIERIRAARPHTVVLAANWSLYPVNVDLGVARAVQVLRSIGVPRIVLVGPLPMWPTRLPALVARAALRRSPPTVPDRLANSQVLLTAQIDRALRELAARESIGYVSPLSVLCADAGCLTVVPGGPIEPMQFDIGHLTPAGSRFVVGRLADHLGLP